MSPPTTAATLSCDLPADSTGLASGSLLAWSP